MTYRWKELLPFIIAALVVIGGVFFTGYFTGKASIPEEEKVQTLVNKDRNRPERVDFSPFWKAWNIINENYVPIGTSTPAANPQEKVYGAIAGLAKSLEDPYTTFLPPSDAKVFKEDISGNFEGVGMQIGKRDGILTVISPLKGTPAAKAGLKSGDKIAKIDGTVTNDMTVDEAVKLIRGERGTDVVFTVVREGHDRPLTISVTRDKIDIPTIDTELRDDGVFVIRLYNFSERSDDEFRRAVREFLRSGSHQLVLDLRGNAGGYLSAAIDMASWFLPTGKEVVIRDAGGKSEPRVYRSRGYNVVGDNFEMAILVDGGTASAAEILAGALQQHGVATLVGTQTFGKGSVQRLFEVTPETELKLTIARWLTPNGQSISQNGLTPDIEVKPATSTSTQVDPQMNRAVELLKGE